MENIIHLFKRIISHAHISINKMSTNFITVSIILDAFILFKLTNPQNIMLRIGENSNKCLF